MEPQRLQADQGWQWIKLGYRLFARAPLLWIVLLAISLSGMIAISVVPVLGNVLGSLLIPAWLAGVMTGCRAVEQGEELELAHLLNGFKHRTSELVTLGGIALIGQLLIMGIMMALGGGVLAGMMMGDTPPHDPAMMAQAMAGGGIAMLIGLLLFSALMMAMQFAPMLVYFHGLTPVEALKLSLRGFLANVGPMLIYGIGMLILAFLASLPMMLGWIVLVPVLVTSLYTSFSAIFPLPQEPAPPSAPETAATEEDPFKPKDGTF